MKLALLVVPDDATSYEQTIASALITSAVMDADITPEQAWERYLMPAYVKLREKVSTP